MKKDRKIIFRIHALLRMVERGISKNDAIQVIKYGESIKEYPDDTPYPRKLKFLMVNGRPLHVVFAEKIEENELIIITVYEPDSKIWIDYRRKKQ